MLSLDKNVFKTRGVSDEERAQLLKKFEEDFAKNAKDYTVSQFTDGQGKVVESAFTKKNGTANDTSIYCKARLDPKTKAVLGIEIAEYRNYRKIKSIFLKDMHACLDGRATGPSENRVLRKKELHAQVAAINLSLYNLHSDLATQQSLAGKLGDFYRTYEAQRQRSENFAETLADYDALLIRAAKWQTKNRPTFLKINLWRQNWLLSHNADLSRYRDTLARLPGNPDNLGTVKLQFDQAHAQAANLDAEIKKLEAQRAAALKEFGVLFPLPTKKSKKPVA